MTRGGKVFQKFFAVVPTIFGTVDGAGKGEIQLRLRRSSKRGRRAAVCPVSFLPTKIVREVLVMALGDKVSSSEPGDVACFCHSGHCSIERTTRPNLISEGFNEPGNVVAGNG